MVQDDEGLVYLLPSIFLPHFTGKNHPLTDKNLLSS
jgi:hypothetical protein